MSAHPQGHVSNIASPSRNAITGFFLSRRSTLSGYNISLHILCLHPIISSPPVRPRRYHCPAFSDYDIPQPPRTHAGCPCRMRHAMPGVKQLLRLSHDSLAYPPPGLVFLPSFQFRRYAYLDRLSTYGIVPPAVNAAMLTMPYSVIVELGYDD